jgi:hypothetical protein
MKPPVSAVTTFALHASGPKLSWQTALPQFCGCQALGSQCLCCNAMRRGGFNNPSGWYEPGAAATTAAASSSDRAAPLLQQPATRDDWNDAADSLPSGRFGAAASKAAGDAKTAAAATGADDSSAVDSSPGDSSAVRFLDEEPDGALFINQDSAWTGAADAGLASSLQAQLPDWAATSADGSGNGSGGGFGATDSTALHSNNSAAAGDGSQGGGSSAGGPAAAPLQQPAGPAAEDLAARLKAAAEADYDFSDPMTLITAAMEEADLQVCCSLHDPSLLGCSATPTAFGHAGVSQCTSRVLCCPAALGYSCFEGAGPMSCSDLRSGSLRHARLNSTQSIYALASVLSWRACHRGWLHDAAGRGRPGG